MAIQERRMERYTAAGRPGAVPGRGSVGSSRAPAAGRTRLTPFGRFVLILALIGVASVAGAAGAAARKPHAQRWRCVVVRPGDSLWSVAGRVSSEDKRIVVDRIMRRNHLAGAVITPGTGLWVPAGPGYDAADAECGTG